jgi:hypothetical protein
MTIACIAGIVFVKIISGPLLFGAQPEAIRDKDQLTLYTAQIDSLGILEKRVDLFSVAQWTERMMVFWYHTEKSFI